MQTVQPTELLTRVTMLHNHVHSYKLCLKELGKCIQTEPFFQQFQGFMISKKAALLENSALSVKQK